MAADPAGERQVYRGAGAVVLWWAWAIFAVASLAVIAARYHDHASAVTATVILAITGIMYACALHPRVMAGPEGISVDNPLRTHLIPWPAVTRVAPGPDPPGALRRAAGRCRGTGRAQLGRAGVTAGARPA